MKKTEETNDNKVANDNIGTNKKERGIIIGILIIALIIILLIVGICLYLFSPLFKTPKQRLAMAAAKTFYDEPSSLYGSEGLLFLTLVADGKFQYDTELSLDKIKLTDDFLGLYEDDTYKYAAGASISQEGYVNIPDRQTFISGTTRYNGFRLVSPEIYIDDSDVYITDSHLIEDNLYFNTETFGEDFANSDAIYEMASILLSDDTCNQIEGISFNVYDSLEDLQKYAAKLAFSDSKNTIKNLKNVYSHIEVELTDKEAEIDLGGDDTKCTEYLVTLYASVLEDYNNEYVAFLSEYLDEDMTFYVYVDRKNRVVAIKSTYMIPTSEMSEDYVGVPLSDIYYDVTFSFPGKKYALSEASFTLDVYDDSTDDLILSITGDYAYEESDKSVVAGLTINDNSIDIAGKLETDHDSFTFDTNDIEINLNNSLVTGSIDCSALIGMSKLTEDIDTLSGKDYPIFELTREDINTLLNEASQNILPF